MAARKKDLADFDFGGGGLDFGSDPGSFDWSSIIGQQPENGSFVGPGGTDLNGLTPDDYSQLFQQAGEGLNPDGTYNLGGGGGDSTMQSIIRALTGSGGGGSAMGALGALLPFAASIFGGLQQRNATQDATRQIQDSLANANQQITGLLGGAQATYKPYMDAGLGALGKLQAMQPSNLASAFSPIGSGRGLNLSQIVKGS